MATNLRKSLTQAGITGSVCDIVEKYVSDEQEHEQEEQEELEHNEQKLSVDPVEQHEELQLEEHVEVTMSKTELRKSLTQAGINESVCSIVEKYTPGLVDDVEEVHHQVDEVHQGANTGQSESAKVQQLTHLRKSLQEAGITQSVVEIVVKYTGDYANMTEEERQQAEEVMQGDAEWKRIEQNLRQAGLQESDIKIVEKYSPHRSPRKMSEEEVHEEEQHVQEEEEKVEEEVHEAQQEQQEEVSPNRLRLTKEEYLKHSAPAQQVVKEYLVEDLEESRHTETHQAVQEEQQVEEVQDQEGRWGKCSINAQEILEGYEPSTELVDEE